MIEQGPFNCGILDLAAIVVLTEGTTVEPAGIIKPCDYDDAEDNSPCNSFVGIVRQSDDSQVQVVRYDAVPCEHQGRNLEPLQTPCPYFAAQLAAKQVIPETPEG